MNNLPARPLLQQPAESSKRVEVRPIGPRNGHSRRSELLAFLQGDTPGFRRRTDEEILGGAPSAAGRSGAAARVMVR